MLSIIETFQNEAVEHLDDLEEVLLELEESQTSRELVDRAFRAIHTIKGAGGIVGFQELCNFTHHLETALDKIRSGGLEINSGLISLFLDAKDHISQLLRDPEATPQQVLDGRTLLDRLYLILPEGEEATLQGLPFDLAATLQAEDKKTSVYRVRFCPDRESLRSGFDVQPVLRELQGLGETRVTTLTKELPTLRDFDPEQCFLSWDITLLTEQPKASIADVFIFVQDDWWIDIQAVDLQDSHLNSDRVGELLIERGVLDSEKLEDVLAEQKEIGHILQQKALASEDEINAALNEQRVTRDTKKSVRGEGNDSTVRVPAARLDKLMNLVGELVIVQARMNQIAHLRNDDDILGISEDLEFLSTELRDNTFSIRMLPIGSTFGRFRRLVRDVSRDLEKNIALETDGAETELDKMMIDKLADPLVHLIRNSMDHGIETAAERQAAGKPARATIQLSAMHAESQVKICIRDDGRGLNTATIRAKALERGLISPEREMSDDEIHKLIFEPGFSTAKTVSDISGRGVGMDVVKRSIHQLSGKISLESEAGLGTTVTIALPMTTAIINGLLVRVAEEFYVLPLGVVEECIELKFNHELDRDFKRLVRVRDEHVPYMRLREWFEVNENRPAIEQIVIARVGNERFGFCVDEVVGQYQTVIKRLGKMYEETVGYSGATIMGDGSVAIVLDPLGLRDAMQKIVGLDLTG